MSQKYFTTLTNIGAALHANAQLQQSTVPWTHLVLGDGNGVEPVPSPAQTGVIREVDRLAISSIEPDPDNPNWIVIEAVIPADRGGYVVRETALMGTAGGNQCIAVGNYPSATKPLLSEGAGSELVIRVVVEIAHTATVTLKIDPAVVIASRDWVEKQHATQQKRGLVRLATIAETLLGDAGDIAVTPEGVMQLITQISADSGMVVISTVGVTNWDVPEVLRSGKKQARVRGVGGGGGGARRTNNSMGQNCSGGAGGGYFDFLLNLTGVSSVPVTVGAGGTSGALEANATAGGTTSFGTYGSALGGVGGQVTGNLPVGGIATSSVANALLIQGETGSTSVPTPAGTAIFGGRGGGSILGFAGPASQTGAEASGYGAGAGGSVDGSVKTGRSGVVVIEW